MSNAPVLPNKKYRIIYADPPWSYRYCNKQHGAAIAHYPTMSQTELKSLKISDIAEDDCFLFMWATFPNLQEALDVIKAWGFTYKTIAFCWVKRNKNGSWFKGIGFYIRSNCEVCLLAIKGSPAKKNQLNHSIGQIVDTVREQHSKKPDVVRERIVEFCGDLPRIELFARQRVSGWDCWGNEVSELDCSMEAE